MKNFFSKYCAFILPVLGSLALASCSKDETPDPVNSISSGISAVVNGVNWEASSGDFKLGSRTIKNGADAFVGTGDTLTIVGVQVLDGDTTAIMISVKLKTDKVGSYRLRSGTAGDGKAYFLNGFSEAALQETKEKYSGGITNGELQISQYDVANYSVSGNFGFSMSATGETTYTVIAGKIDNVTF